METIDSANINKFLVSSGPKIPGQDLPLFRLVWSEDQYERRRGTFIRTYTVTHPKTGKLLKYSAPITEVAQERKYSYIKDRWILEQWVSPEYLDLSELPDAGNGNYEPIFVFEDSKFNPLPLNLRAVQLIVQAATKPKRSIEQRKIDDQNEQELKDIEEQKYLEEALDLSPMQSLLHEKEAIIVPSNYERN